MRCRGKRSLDPPCDNHTVIDSKLEQININLFLRVILHVSPQFVRLIEIAGALVALVDSVGVCRLDVLSDQLDGRESGRTLTARQLRIYQCVRGHVNQVRVLAGKLWKKNIALQSRLNKIADTVYHLTYAARLAFENLNWFRPLGSPASRFSAARLLWLEMGSDVGM